MSSEVKLPRHALFLAALLLGIAVRGVVIYAYRPALLFTDSFSYLNHAKDGSLTPLRPVGYSFFLRPFLHLGDPLTAVQVAQHVLVLLLAVGCYAFLLRRGLPAWGATLAVLPLLLDPLQLVLEHYILSDALFEVMLVLAVLVLLWRHRPGVGEVLWQESSWARPAWSGVRAASSSWCSSFRSSACVWAG